MLAKAHRMMLPSRQRKEIGTPEKPVSQLNTQPMVSPVNASRLPSRAAAHHSGPKRLARPYSAVDFHLLSFASLSWRTPLLATSDGSARRQLRRLHPQHRKCGSCLACYANLAIDAVGVRFLRFHPLYPQELTLLASASTAACDPTQTFGLNKLIFHRKINNPPTRVSGTLVKLCRSSS